MASDDEDENFVIAAIAKARAMHIDSSLKELCAAHGFNPQNIDKLYTTVTTLDMFQTMDFHILTLSKFTVLQDVSIIQAPRVTSLDGLATAAPHLRKLMIIECNLTNLYGLHNCKKLQLLNVDSNQITSLDSLWTLLPSSSSSSSSNGTVNDTITSGTKSSSQPLVFYPSLEIIYLNDNHISTLGSLFTVCPMLKELYIARNRITTLSSSSLVSARSLHTLNIADNHIVSFRDITTLTLLPNLRHMIFSDPHWGENPVCGLSNYSIFTTVTLPRLESLDTFLISPHIRYSTEATFAKKRMYYTMRTQTLARNTGIVANTVEKVMDYISLVLLTSLPVLRHASKILQSYILVSTAGDTPLPPSILSNRILDGDVVVNAKEKLEIINKMILYRTAALLQLRTALSSLHCTIRTCSIAHASRMDIELHSGGNTRLEEGRPPGLITTYGSSASAFSSHPSPVPTLPLLPSIQTHGGDSWFASCTETLRSKFFSSDFAPLHIVGIRVTRVIRVHNRHLRSQFETRTNNILQNQPTLASAVMTNAVVAQNLAHYSSSAPMNTGTNNHNTSFTSAHDQSLSTSFISTVSNHHSDNDSAPKTSNRDQSSSTTTSSVLPLGINNMQNTRKGIEYVFYSPRWTPQGLQESLQKIIPSASPSSLLSSSISTVNSTETAISAMATEILEEALGDRQAIPMDNGNATVTNPPLSSTKTTATNSNDPYSIIARIVEEGFTEEDANVTVPVSPLPFDYAVVPPPVYAPSTLNMKPVKRYPVTTPSSGSSGTINTNSSSVSPMVPQTILPGYQLPQKKIAVGIPVTNSFTAVDFPRLAEIIATTLETNTEFNWRRSITPPYMSTTTSSVPMTNGQTIVPEKEKETPTKESRFSSSLLSSSSPSSSSSQPMNNRSLTKPIGVRPSNTYELAYGIYSPFGSSNTSITSFYAPPSGLRSTSDSQSSSSSSVGGIGTAVPLWWPKHIPSSVAPQLNPSVWLNNAGIDTSSVMQRAILARALRYNTTTTTNNNNSANSSIGTGTSPNHALSSIQTPPRLTQSFHENSVPISNNKGESGGTGGSVAMLSTPIVAHYPSIKTGSLLLCRTFPGNSLDLSTGRSTILQHLANTGGESALTPAVSFYGDPLLTPLGQAAAAPVHSVNIPIAGTTNSSQNVSHLVNDNNSSNNCGKLWVILDPALILPEYIVEWEYIFDGEGNSLASSLPTAEKSIPSTRTTNTATVSSAAINDDAGLQANTHHVHDILHSSGTLKDNSSSSTVGNQATKTQIRSFLNLSTKNLVSSPTASHKSSAATSPHGSKDHHPLHTSGSPSSPGNVKKSSAPSVLESALLMLHQLLQSSMQSVSGPSFISISALLASLQVIGSSIKDGFLFRSLSPSSNNTLNVSSPSKIGPKYVASKGTPKRTTTPFTLQEEMDMRAFQGPLLTCAHAIVHALNNLRLEPSYSYVDSFKRTFLSPASSTNTLYPITSYGALLDQALIEVLCMQPWTYQRVFGVSDTVETSHIRSTVPSSVSATIGSSIEPDKFMTETWSVKLIRRMYQIASAVHLRIDELLLIPITTLCSNQLPPMDINDNVLQSFAYTAPVMDETMLPLHTFDVPLRPSKLQNAASSLSILTSLTLSGCGLVGSLDKYSISSCVSLKYLDISHNNITSLTGLNKCAALWKINASCNSIVTLGLDNLDTVPSVHPRKPNNVWMPDPLSTSSLAYTVGNDFPTTTAWDDNHSMVSDNYLRSYSSSSSSASSSAAESGSSTPSSYASTSSSTGLTTLTAKLARQGRKRSALYGCRFLQEIDLSFNLITKINDIIVIAPGCPLLRSLDLRGNPLMDNIVSVLIESMQLNTTTTLQKSLWSSLSSSVAENKTFAILLSCIPTLDSLNGRIIQDTDRAMIDANSYRLNRIPVSNRNIRAAMVSVNARMQRITNEHGWLSSLPILAGTSQQDSLILSDLNGTNEQSSNSIDSILPAPLVTEETDILEGGTKITPFLIQQIATDGNNKTHLVQLNRSLIPKVTDSQEIGYTSYTFITMATRMKRKHYATSVIYIPLDSSIEPSSFSSTIHTSASKVSLFQDIDTDINHHSKYSLNEKDNVSDRRNDSLIYHHHTAAVGQPKIVTLISDTPHGHHRSIGYTLVSQYSNRELNKHTHRANADDLRLLPVTPHGEGSLQPSQRTFPEEESKDSSPMGSFLYGTDSKLVEPILIPPAPMINISEILTNAAETILSLVRQGIQRIVSPGNGKKTLTSSSSSPVGLMKFPLQATTLQLSNLFLNSTALTTKDAVHIFGSLHHLSYIDLSYNDLQSLIVLPWYLPSATASPNELPSFSSMRIPGRTVPNEISDSAVNFDNIIMDEYMEMLPLLNGLALCSTIETLNLSSCNLQQLGIPYPSNWSNTFIQSIIASIKLYHNREKESSETDPVNDNNGKLEETGKIRHSLSSSYTDNDSSMVHPIPPLAFLHLYISPLTGCTNLTRLDLSRNRLTDSILSLARLYLLPSLSMLSLEGNLLLTFDGIRQCRSLTELYAGNNKIGGSEDPKPNASSSSTSTDGLSISFGPRILRSLGKEFFPKLIILDLMGNPVVHVPGYREYALLHIPKLKVLDSIGIHNDEIKHIREKNIGRITLEILEEKAIILTQTKGTSQRQPTDSTMEGDLLQDENDGGVCLSRLTELDLSSSKYKDIDRLLPTSLPQLRKLCLDYNNFTTDSLQGLVLLLYSPVLRKLTLSHNKVHSLYPALGRTPSSSTNSNGNSIHSAGKGTKSSASFAPLLPAVAEALVSLSSSMGIQSRTVTLPSSPLTNILDFSCYLEYLDLSYNGIPSMENLGLGSLPYLRILNLTHNEITRIQGLADCTSLQELWLDSNQIKIIDNDAVNNLLYCSNLAVLSLSENSVRNIPGFITSSTVNEAFNRLTTFDLRANRLAEIMDIEPVFTLSSLVQLTIANNPVARKTNYRNITIGRMPYLFMLDGKEITDDERITATAFMEAQTLLTPVVTSNDTSAAGNSGNPTNSTTVPITNNTNSNSSTGGGINRPNTPQVTATINSASAPLISIGTINSAAPISITNYSPMMNLPFSAPLLSVSSLSNTAATSSSSSAISPLVSTPTTNTSMSLSIPNTISTSIMNNNSSLLSTIHSVTGTSITNLNLTNTTTTAPLSTSTGGGNNRRITTPITTDISPIVSKPPSSASHRHGSTTNTTTTSTTATPITTTTGHQIITPSTERIHSQGMRGHAFTSNSSSNNNNNNNAVVPVSVILQHGGGSSSSYGNSTVTLRGLQARQQQGSVSSSSITNSNNTTNTTTGNNIGLNRTLSGESGTTSPIVTNPASNITSMGLGSWMKTLTKK